MAKKKTKKKKKKKQQQTGGAVKDIDKKAFIAQKKAQARSKAKEKKGFSSIGNYFRGARTELKKVVWPTRPEVIAASIIVLITALITATYVGLLDSLFAWILKTITARFTQGI